MADKLVSTVHALIVGLFCLYILWFDDAVNANPVWGDPSLVKLNVAITCGYLLYDLVLLACNWSTMGDGFFVCHHLAALYAYGYVLTRGVLPYFANFRLISELSTPFVNQRWFFESLKYPRSHRLVVLNGMAMAVVFFLVRTAVMPSYWASVFATFGTEEFERLGRGAQVAWITSCIALDILNMIWMYKIGRGCYKVMTGERRPEAQGRSGDGGDVGREARPQPRGLKRRRAMAVQTRTRAGEARRDRTPGDNPSPPPSRCSPHTPSNPLTSAPSTSL
uniref:TLC domain containing 4b n=1 Tax=Gasterosteus aculeatus aculeatus TaxID=481459 RepID=A0AAQ4RBA3_GASAC